MTSLATTSLALVVAALATGCAVDSQTAPSNQPTSTREYRTGSNIPVREPRSTTSEEKAAAARRPTRRALPIRPSSRRTEARRAARRYFSGSAMKPIRVSPAFWTMPISSATRP
jgi:hypothetical protein